MRNKRQKQPRDHVSTGWITLFGKWNGTVQSINSSLNSAGASSRWAGQVWRHHFKYHTDPTAETSRLVNDMAPVRFRECPYVISITNKTGTVLHSNNEIKSFSVFKIRWTDIYILSGEAEIESDTEKWWINKEITEKIPLKFIRWFDIDKKQTVLDWTDWSLSLDGLDGGGLEAGQLQLHAALKLVQQLFQ